MNVFDELTTPARPKLNEGQQAAYDEIMAYLCSGREELMWVLKGYAGTGKTFLLTRIVEELHRKHTAGVGDFRIVMSAPTHKAVRVMKKFSTFPINAVHFSTVHALLGLRAEIDERGREKFVESKDRNEIRIEQFNVLFLDETSMLADELWVLLLKYVRKGLKIIFVGDPVQIPPVNHMETIPFKATSKENYNMGISELSQIMRQAGENPILRLATTIRMGYKTVPHFQISSDMKSDVGGKLHGIELVDEHDDERINKLIMQYFVCDAFEADSDHMKIIAWRNETVNNFNRLVRNRIYAEELTHGELVAIMPGEKLIMDKPLTLENGRVLLSTNEEIEVVSYELKRAKIEYFTPFRDASSHSWIGKNQTDEFLHYNAMVSYFDNLGKKVTANIRILHESEEIRMRQLLDGLAKLANEIPFGNPLKKNTWHSFYNTQRLFAQVKYNYAITAHKSQGSTYDNVLILDWDLAMNRKIEERNRIRYVAITRARYLACIQK